VSIWAAGFSWSSGFGDFVVLSDQDHIHLCKPKSRDDIPYVTTLQYLKDLQSQLEDEQSNKSD
jgi:hypothetical protein